MGGSALEMETNRLSALEFKVAQQLVSKHLEDRGVTYHFVQAYRDKPSHGDMDVLVKQDTTSKNRLVDSFGAQETSFNGRVVSLDFGGDKVPTFQLDLVFMQPEWWEMAKAFHDWNVLGNLMGKVARFRRFKYGFQGLRLPYFADLNKSQKLGEFVVSRDPKAVFAFLGYDWERFQQGFDTLESVFEYAMSSRWAARNVFRPEQLTASQRQRDRKRSGYQKFEKWLERQFNPNELGKTTDAFVPRPSHRQALDDAAEAFPEANVKEQVNEAKDEWQLRQAASAVFNGKHAMERFGVEGRELGAVLGELKSRYDNWHKHVLENGRQRMLGEFKRVMAEVLS
jgi:hypothetical protein